MHKITKETERAAARLFAYFPFRRVWVALIDGNEELICKTTAHRASRLAKKGFKVYELVRT